MSPESRLLLPHCHLSSDPLAQFDDVQSDSLLIPALKFCNQLARWTGNSAIDQVNHPPSLFHVNVSHDVKLFSFFDSSHLSFRLRKNATSLRGKWELAPRFSWRPCLGRACRPRWSCTTRAARSSSTSGRGWRCHVASPSCVRTAVTRASISTNPPVNANTTWNLPELNGCKVVKIHSVQYCAISRHTVD